MTNKRSHIICEADFPLQLFYKIDFLCTKTYLKCLLSAVVRNRKNTTDSKTPKEVTGKKEYTSPKKSLHIWETSAQEFRYSPLFRQHEMGRFMIFDGLTKTIGKKRKYYKGSS